jgi:hypothetical protein
MDLLLSFGLFRTYIHGKQRLGPLYREIGSSRPVVGVSTYRFWISASVNTPCMWRRPCPEHIYIAWTNLLSYIYTYVRDTCMQVSRDSDATVVFIRRNPSSGDPGARGRISTLPHSGVGKAWHLWTTSPKYVRHKIHTHACDNTYTICWPLAMRDEINVISCGRVETAIRRVWICQIDKKYNHV